MKLSQIKLAGFKSFATPTTIDVSGNLIGIVGPNGCGKSNVIDAIRWVLGESSAKQLRGESMQDVIFNGSNSRKAISRATVELIFDNSAKIISGLWSSYNEIAIKRLISRSGESEYYINNQVVRRRDITDLFLGTGVGVKGYAVIEQGMISRIIDAKAEDLMLYLEEASGVSKYRLKRKETIIKLKDTTDNLSRIQDIRGELDKQLIHLTNQAVVARKYQQLNDELKYQQIFLMLLKIFKADTILKKVDQEIAHNNTLYKQNELDITILDKQLKDFLVIKAQKDEEQIDLTNQFNTLRMNVARLEERKKNSLNLQQRIQSDKKNLEREILEINAVIVDYNKLIENTNCEIIANLTIIEEKQISREDKITHFEIVDEVYKNANQLLIGFVTEIGVAKHELDLLRNSFEHKKHQLNSLNARVKRLEQEKSSNTLDFNQSYFLIKDNIADLLVELEHIDFERRKARENKQNLFERINTKTNKLNSYKNNISSLTSKLNTINELLQKQTNSPSSFNCLDKSVINDNIKLLWQNIQVSIGYELAVEVVLGEILKAIHIGSFDQLKSIPESLFALWYSNDVVKNKNEENKVTLDSKINSLDNFVTINNEVFFGIYNILVDYLVCENFSVALSFLEQLSVKQKIITKDGHIVTKNYVIFNANSGKNHILEYQNKIIALENELKLLQLEYTKLESILSVDNNLYLKLEHDLIKLEELYQTNYTKKHNLQLEFTKEEQIYIQNKQFQERVSNELKLLLEEVTHVQVVLDELDIKLEDSEIALTYLVEKQQLAELNKLEAETNYNQAKISLNSIDVEINQKLIDNEVLSQKNTNLEALIKDKTTQLDSISNKIQSLALEESTLTVDTEAPELSRLQDDLTLKANTIAEKNTEIVELNALILSLKEQLSKLSKQKDELLTQLNHHKLKQQEQLILLQSHNEAMVELSIDETLINKAKIAIKEGAVDSIKVQDLISDLQKQIEELGLVNLKAIEDLESCEVKQQEMILQIEDLTSALNSLEGAIKQIDQESRNILNATYIKVCASFAVYFKTLFGGGDAILELTDKDILKAGIQIFATPPGKKNSSIHLLSGGEKALTAMSLVFAFFSLNPAPFCLLDEVDAPLDDANTARFCNLVQELSNSTQFVYISHNRLTMEMASKLIGVTMQEKGISTTVSVDLVDAIKHAQ